jgi:hypothetical protein
MRALAALALAACACVPDEGPLMDPGSNCMECHGRGGADPAWTAAGTVFPSPSAPTGDGVEGVRVHLFDANGRSVTLRTNRAGNFYTRERLAFPLQVTLEGSGFFRAMPHLAPNGECNACHAFPPPPPPVAGIPVTTGRIATFGGLSGGELMLPGEDCLRCHDGRVGPQFTAAGTAFESIAGGAGAPGVLVRITGADGAEVVVPSNAAGNFFAQVPIAFPARVQIEAAGEVHPMLAPIADGSCNRCHRPGGEAGTRVSAVGHDHQ